MGFNNLGPATTGVKVLCAAAVHMDATQNVYSLQANLVRSHSPDVAIGILI